MANIYVRSTDGSDADNGSTWALAKATISGAAGIGSAGDVICVSSSHSEAPSTDQTWTFAGTKASPVYVLGVNDSAEPPTAEATGAITTSTTGAYAINNVGSRVAIIRNLTIEVGSGQSTTRSVVIGSASSLTRFSKSKIRLLTTGGSSVINLGGAVGGSSNATAHFDDVTVRFAAGGQAITIPTQSCQFTWSGGGIESGGTSPNTLMTTLSNAAEVTMEALDLSAGSSSMNLFNSTSVNLSVTVRNCKLPGSWTGSLHSGTPGLGSRFAMYNCDSGDTNYRMMVASPFGTILSETTIVRTGGASDGTTPISWKMVSNADAEFAAYQLRSDEIVRRFPGTSAENSAWTPGAAVTVTVEVITDGVTLTDAECWLEVQYLGTSGVPLGSFATDAKADVLATAANQTSSSESWTTTGMSSPVKQKLSVTITPEEKGVIHAVVKLAKASTTVYVDPKLTIS